MKYYVVVLAAILMTVTLAGCGENYTEDAPTTDPAAQTEYVGDGDTSTTDDPGDTEAEDTGDTGDTNDAGEDETGPETLAPTGDADGTDEVGVEEYPAIFQWYLDELSDPEMRDYYEAKWATDTPEEREKTIKRIEEYDNYKYARCVTGEHPAIFQWFLDNKCNTNERAYWEEKWENGTPEDRKRIITVIKDSHREEYKEYLNGNGNTGTETKPETEPGPPEFGSVEAVAALGGKEATVQENEDECLVYIFDETKNHGNPYDVTWDYGKDYNSYVAAVDWSLVFDADYYKATFPMLAVQYHNDDALLLKHFQTVGIHEGRQGSKDFNVAAYMDNCDESLRKAFGDNYECYYLYYLLHQDTESGVKTTGSYKKQLAQELTVVQSDELRHVNKYRDEVNAGTVEFDSEMSALANYRAYMDCTEGWDEHDGLYHMMDTGELYDYMDMVDMDTYCENKCTKGYNTGKEHAYDPSIGYRMSESHYETMVDPEYNYVGCSNFYVSDKDYNWSGQYDNNVITFGTYADVVTTAYHTK